MRVILFGVDGLAFRVLDPLIERGKLPNFQRVQSGGVRGVLRSTIPPMTPPAWMAISTGLSSAMHGVYDFWDYEQTANGPVAHVMTHRKGGKAIWNILSEWGKQVIVANVPLTYPPEPVNGIMVSGYMAPDTKATITYPASFQDEFLQHIPDYQVDLDPAVSGGQAGDPLVEVLKMTQRRLSLFRMLLDRPWDFCFLVCSGADRIQHLCWDKIMEMHPEAVAYYQMLDEALGMMLGMLQPDDLLMIVSDHGFQGVQRKFYIHEYLYQRGLLQMQGGRRTRLQVLLLGQARAVIRSCHLQKLARVLRAQLRHAGVMAVEKEQHSPNLPQLDWNESFAWIPSASGSLAGYAEIFFSDRLSEEEILELMHSLQQIRDPLTDEFLVTEMWREDVYGSGDCAFPQRRLLIMANEQTTLPTELGRSELWEEGDPASGIHHPEGVLYLYGGGVWHGQRIEASTVYDVVPTILAYMDLPLPEGLIGTAIDAAFDPSLSSQRSAKHDGLVMRKLKNRMSGSR